MNNTNLIVIDDEIDFANYIFDVAQQEELIPMVFNSGQAFMDNYDEQTIDAIILDLMMPDIDGIEVIRFLAEKKCQASIILMSGFDQGVLHSAQQLASAQNLNILHTLNKPFRITELRNYLKELKNISTSEKKVHTQSEISFEQLKNALDKDELIVYYQPKVDIHQHNIALEALIRWNHPIHGIIGPDNFIPLFEEHNLIDALTWIVIHKVMKQCAHWNSLRIQITVAINMSASTLKDLTLPEKLTALIQEYHLQASQIILEVTETALMQELITSLDILTRLRLKGFCLSIDDFGTGYSSLIQLHRVPFSEIKVDKSFVMNMLKDNEAAAIAETVIVLGHKLGMKVVAEGVESQQILNRLKELGCDIAQGYYISRPQPSDIITEWLQQKFFIG